MASNQRIRVYSWEFPVRLTHWTNALCMVAFVATGLYIADPYVYAYSTSQYIMGWMRYVHFVTGYVLLCSFVIRLYWAFMGNKYAGWRVWFPYTEKTWPNVVDAFRFYTFQQRKPPYAIGHTGLAGVTYFFVYLLFLFQIVSGFALLSLSSTSGLVHAVGGWLTGIMPIQDIRVYHHMAMWLIVPFVMIHLYIAWWVDGAEKNGLMGSIFSGYKFVTGKEWE